MAWVAVDKDGREFIYECKPIRHNNGAWQDHIWDEVIELPQGTIKKLIGRELTWNDEPVELK